MGIRFLLVPVVVSIGSSSCVFTDFLVDLLEVCEVSSVVLLLVGVLLISIGSRCARLTNVVNVVRDWRKFDGFSAQIRRHFCALFS